MIQAAIIGGGGFTAGELIRILLHHPGVNLAYVMSESQAGKVLSDTHQDLIGDTDIRFSSNFNADVDVLFLCKGHGKSKQFLQEYQVPKSTTIIDLSRDFRLKGDNPYIYGLPEMNRKAIKSNNRIANPGCFATAIQLALYPLAQAKALHADVHIQGITGATGAGQAKLDTTHFSWRNNNISVYKPFNHQHLAEVYQTIHQCQSAYGSELCFIPMRGDFTRGILISSYVKTDLSESELLLIYQEQYADEPFTHMTEHDVHLKQVVNTNKCVIHVEKHGDRALIISAIDNLLKGASGQAVQNMNIHFGLEEHTGLHLKPMAY